MSLAALSFIFQISTPKKPPVDGFGTVGVQREFRQLAPMPESLRQQALFGVGNAAKEEENERGSHAGGWGSHLWGTSAQG